MPPPAPARRRAPQPGERVGQVVQHAAAIDVVEGAEAASGQIQQGAFDEADVVELARRRPGFGDAARGGAAVEPDHLARPLRPGEVLRQHDRAVAGAAARDEGAERRRGRAAGAEDPVIDLAQVARAADHQPLRFVARVAGGIGIGFVLVGEAPVGRVGHRSVSYKLLTDVRRGRRAGFGALPIATWLVLGRGEGWRADLRVRTNGRMRVSARSF